MFKRNRRTKMFQRILITSSLTIIATVIFLIVLITNYYADTIVQRETDLNVRTMERIEDYFVNKQNDWDELIRDLYIKEELMEDVTNVLHFEYDEYMRLRLENYANQTSFTPNDTFTFLNAFFSQDDDVNAAILQSSNYPEIFYEFIYNYGEWNKSLNGLHFYDVEGRVNPNLLEHTFTETLEINNPATLEKMGDLTVYYSTNAIERMLYSEEESIASSYFLVDQHDNVLYEDNKGIASEKVKELFATNEAEAQEWENRQFIIQTMDNVNGTTSYMVIPKKDLNAITFVRGTMWMLIVLTLTIALVLTYVVIRRYSARIERIDQTMREVQQGNLAVRIPLTKHKDELSTIASSLNTMLDDINEYIEQVYVLDLKQQEAELKALQSQINPHFLFNTLETIRMSAVIDGSKTAGKMIYHLSRLLRYSLHTNESVPLREEVENAKQYLQLIQLQHPEKLTYKIDLLKEVEDSAVQKLVLQPIIENYVIHGFRKESNSNHLDILTEVHGEDIWIIIKDNGIGIEKSRLVQIEDHMNDLGNEMESIGMKNVHQRLKVKYGNAYGLRIESEVSVGTTVTLIIPLGGPTYV